MIRVFDVSDRFNVATLLGRAYGRSYEPTLVQALREAGDVQAEFVWDENGQVLGHTCLGRHQHPQDWCIVNTVAVAPEYRGRGIGSDLVCAALEAARQADAGAVTVLGHAKYYQRFGFTRTAAEGLEASLAGDNTLMYPIRIENAGIETRLEYPAAYSWM